MNLVVAGEFVCAAPWCEEREADPKAAGWSQIIWETDANTTRQGRAYAGTWSGWWCPECGDELVAELERQGHRKVKCPAT